MEYYEDKIISELLPKETIVINETNTKLLLLDYYSITMVIAGKVLKGGEMKDCTVLLHMAIMMSNQSSWCIHI